MIKIKSYGSLLLLSVVLLAACSKKQIQPKMLDGNEEITEKVSKDIILISNAQELQAIKNNLSGNYIQTADIDLAELGVDFEPIVTSLAAFVGTYNGNNKTIKNLNINKADQDTVGLFRFTNEPAKLENMILVNVNVTGRNIVGGLIGYAANPNISDIQIIGTSTVNGSGSNIGGLIGRTVSAKIEVPTITRVRSNANVFAASIEGGGNVGGLIGYSAVTNISYSSATGNVTMKGNANSVSMGGLVGNFSGISLNIIPTISYSHATGDVGGNAFDIRTTQIGGLVGATSSYIQIYNSYATGNVQGQGYVGGLVGNIRSTYTTGNKSIVSQSYATGNVTGKTNYLGGLIGCTLDVKVEYCYSEKGSVISLYSSSLSSAIGGLIGRLDVNSDVTQSYATGNVQGFRNTGPFFGEKFSSRVSITNNFIGEQTVTINNVSVTPSPVPGITKLTKNQLNPQVFEAANWDFTIWNRITQFGVWPKLQRTGGTY